MTFPRQPDHVTIAPSNQSPWIGWTDTPEDRFTRAQRYSMAKLGVDDSEVITVFREATSREMVWGPNSAPPVFQFDCPVIRREADGRVRIIAPGGDVKLVLANGWVKLPSRLNRHLLDRKDA